MLSSQSSNSQQNEIEGCWCLNTHAALSILMLCKAVNCVCLEIAQHHSDPRPDETLTWVPVCWFYGLWINVKDSLLTHKLASFYHSYVSYVWISVRIDEEGAEENRCSGNLNLGKYVLLQSIYFWLIAEESGNFKEQYLNNISIWSSYFFTGLKHSCTSLLGNSRWFEHCNSKDQEHSNKNCIIYNGSSYTRPSKP